jgi:hypothetical protein
MDRYAMLSYLEHKPRQARLRWGSRRHNGHIRAWPRSGAISFAVDGGAASSMGLPEEGTTVSLRFRIRGLGFLCEGAVRQSQREKGRILIKPEVVEWSVQRPEVEGVGKVAEAIDLLLPGRGELGRTVCVTKLQERSLLFVCWPCSSSLRAPTSIQGRLVLPQQPRLQLGLIIRRAAPVFPGAQGRIVEAEIVEGVEAYQQRVAALGDASG